MAALRAKTSFACFVGGVRTHITEGTIVDSGDPVVKQHKDLFESPDGAVSTQAAPASRPTVKKV